MCAVRSKNGRVDGSLQKSPPHHHPHPTLQQRPPIDKTLVFYGVRATLGLVSAACEATFVDGVTRRLGPRPGALTFLLLLTNAGVFQVYIIH